MASVLRANRLVGCSGNHNSKNESYADSEHMHTVPEYVVWLQYAGNCTVNHAVVTPI